MDREDDVIVAVLFFMLFMLVFGPVICNARAERHQQRQHMLEAE